MSFFDEIHVFKANRIAPDGTPRFVSYFVFLCPIQGLQAHMSYGTRFRALLSNNEEMLNEMA